MRVIGGGAAGGVPEAVVGIEEVEAAVADELTGSGGGRGNGRSLRVEGKGRYGIGDVRVIGLGDKELGDGGERVGVRSGRGGDEEGVTSEGKEGGHLVTHEVIDGLPVGLEDDEATGKEGSGSGQQQEEQLAAEKMFHYFFSTLRTVSP